MGERNLTLFAVHLHNNGDVQLGPERLRSGGRTETSGRTGWKRGRDALPIPLAVGAVAVFAFVALAWRVLADR